MGRVVRVACLSLAMLVVVGTVAAGQETDSEAPEWPPGVWLADFVVEGGVSDDGHTTFLGGEMALELAIDEAGSVVDGSLVTLPFDGVDGLQLEVVLTDPAPATMEMTVVVDMALGGTADAVLASGTWLFDGVFTNGDAQVPNRFEWSPSFVLTPDDASCLSVWGDLVDPAALVEQGSIVTLTARYLALPAGVGAGEPDLGEIVATIQEIADGLLAEDAPDPADIAVLVGLLQAASGELVRSNLCDDVDGDAATAAHEWLERLLQDVLLAVFRTLDTQGDAYSTGELIELLRIGVGAGAVGASTADPDTAQALLGLFETWLTVRVGEAHARGDRDEIVSILVTAEQYGMQALANESYSRLHDLDGP